jgi:hypothetical protein
MALLTGLRIKGLLLGKQVSSMTFVTGVNLMAITLGSKAFYLLLALYAHVVTPTTPPLPLYKLFGLKG